MIRVLAVPRSIAISCVKKLKIDFLNNIDIIHLQNQKIIGILPKELKYSEITYSMTMDKSKFVKDYLDV